MAIKRIQNARTYIGSSTDLKPRVGDANTDGTLVSIADLTLGSTLYLTDLGITETFDGSNWNRPGSNPVSAADPNMLTLLEILLDIQTELARIRFGMIEAGMCVDNNVSDFQRSM